MSRKSSIKASTTKIPNFGKKTFKVIAAFFHGPELEVMGNDLAKNIETGPSKKILAVRVKDIIVEGEERMAEGIHVEDHMKKMQIEQGIERCKKQYESIWKSLPTQLEDDLRLYWSECSEMFNNKNIEIEADGHYTQMLEEIIPRKIREIDMRLFNEEIQKEDIERQICDYFLVIFGKVSSRTLVELKMNHIPLEAVIHFIQCPVHALETNFPQLYEDIDFWKKSPDTKNVGIFIESCMPAAKHLEERYANDIYDQFIWYLYDIEMLKQQFITYQAEYVEINDTAMPQDQQAMPECDEILSTKVTSDDTAVGVYLDNLCYAIEGQTLKRRRHSCLHLRPFIENDYGRVIVEEANKLVQAAIATQMNMVSYWRVADVLVNALKDVPIREHCAETTVPLPRYYELLSWESFAQRVETEKFLFDECYCADMTDKCKLYTLRRTFYKVVEMKRKFRLPTKLCYRDFCQYIAPTLGPILRCYNERTKSTQYSQDEDPEQDMHTLNEYHYEFHDPDLNNPKFWTMLQEEVRPKFFGLTFADTLQQLAVADKVYRFDTGYIRCSLENWLYKENKMTIEICLYDCRIYAHRWEDFVSQFPRIRIITKNGITCNIGMKEDQRDVNVSIQWPNDCQIQYVYDNDAHAIEQRYHWTRRHELKRLYTQHGCVLSYLPGDIIEVLTPNGFIYMLYPNNYNDVNDNDNDLKYYRPVVGVTIADELAFVRSLNMYGIDCEHFDVTRSDGKKLRVMNGVAIEEKEHYLIYEWTDYSTNQCYAERDDGVKMVWSVDDFKCYYPTGTVITTTTEEDYIEMSFGCLHKSTENILRKINPTLVEKVANKAKMQETYITYKVNYLMQHKHYASIAFDDQNQIEIFSPGQLKLVLKNGNVVLVSIGGLLLFRITSGVCHINSGVSVARDKDMNIRLNLYHDTKEVLSFHYRSAQLTLYADGEMTASDGTTSTPKPFEEEIYFLAKRYKFGMAFLSKEKYDEITKNFKEQTYFYDSPTKAVLFKPIWPIDQQFSIPIPEHNFEKFKAGCYEKPEVNDVKMERVLCVRTIHKLESIPEDICSLVRKLYFIEGTLGNHITEALEHFFVKKVKPRKSVKWKNKIDVIRDDLEFKRQRMGIYNAMLRKKIFPKYHEFQECNGDLKLLNVNKLLPRFSDQESRTIHTTK